MLKPGDVVRYGYLWAREADQGEEAGRKVRPACVIVRTPTNPAALFVFPITSQPLDAARPHLPITQIECAAADSTFRAS